MPCCLAMMNHIKVSSPLSGFAGFSLAEKWSLDPPPTLQCTTPNQRVYYFNIAFINMNIKRIKYPGLSKHRYLTPQISTSTIKIVGNDFHSRLVCVLDYAHWQAVSTSLEKNPPSAFEKWKVDRRRQKYGSTLH